MALRVQKNGGQTPWSLPEVEAGLKHFFEEHKHYPTSTEVDAYQYLPSARSIERSFGGLVGLRKRLGLGDNHDLRTGKHSSERAHRINKRAYATERLVYDYLIDKFGKEFVHREYFFTDDHRTRADFFVYDAGKGFCVDVFYPASPRNLSGCLNIKLTKYAGMGAYLEYPVIFLQMNESISQSRLDALLKAKKRPLAAGQYLMEWNTFKEFCSSRDPLRVLQGRATMEKLGLRAK
ncbi:MAG: hypothetical protein AAB919_00350 [Patescibacteria group bacterium]